MRYESVLVKGRIIKLNKPFMSIDGYIDSRQEPVTMEDLTRVINNRAAHGWRVHSFQFIDANQCVVLLERD